MKIEKEVGLGMLTTMKAGGPARFFATAQTDAEIRDATLFAEAEGVSLFVLGEGSNILVSDNGIPGLVLKLGTRKIAFEDYEKGQTLLTADGGAHWDTLVQEAVLKNLSGIENLSLIPGTAGAAPVQNIGAYGREVADTLLWVEVFDQNTKKQKRLGKEECGFSYRESIFKKKEGGSLIITRIALLLHPDGTPHTAYKDVREYFETRHINAPTLADTRRAVIDIRTRKLPDLARVGTAGSFFKNPVITKEKYGALRTAYPDLPGFALTDGNIKVPLAWILDHTCGLRGYREGAVGLYEGQPLAIVNYGGATAEEIRTFADTVARAVEEKTGILPEYEVSLVGDWEL